MPPKALAIIIVFIIFLLGLAVLGGYLIKWGKNEGKNDEIYTGIAFIGFSSIVLLIGTIVTFSILS